MKGFREDDERGQKKTEDYQPWKQVLMESWLRWVGSRLSVFSVDISLNHTTEATGGEIFEEENVDPSVSK